MFTNTKTNGEHVNFNFSPFLAHFPSGHDVCFYSCRDVCGFLSDTLQMMTVQKQEHQHVYWECDKGKMNKENLFSQQK